jgi:3-phenylpropionate/trans-cinnamate dioxygenase ferredoxin reductase subunit
VVTTNGRELDADAVVIGAGVIPEVTLARSAGLEIGDSGGVRADPGLETSTPGVFVAGDIAEYDSVIHGRRLRIEHWDVAFNQGKTAALNLLGRGHPHEVVPYFFSDLSDWASLEYVGPASSWDREIVRGSIDDGEFAIFYLSDGELVAGLSVGRPDDLEHARRLLTSHADLSERVDELGDLSTDLASV